MFARKVIRHSYYPEINNEIRAIEKLSEDNHPNIISILKHGWLFDDQHYFIDMELCELTLEEYIQGKFKPLFGLSRYLDPKQPKERNIWAVIYDIASGLAFIHKLGEVHRDLKPRNGLAKFIKMFSLLSTAFVER